MNGRLLLAHYEGQAGSVLAGRGQGPGSDLSPSTCAPWGSSTPGGRAPASLVVKWVERGSGRSFPCRSQGH